MKRIYLTVFIALAAICSNAQAIKVSTLNAAFSKNSEGGLQHEMGVPASTVSQKEFGGGVVYFKIEVLNYKAIKAKYRLELVVYQQKDGASTYNYGQEFGIPTKNGWVSLYSEFTEGTYLVKIRDKENEDDVYSQATFTVAPKPKVDYKNNSTLVVCKSVDDNWMPVGQAAKIKKGSCMNFLYKAKDRLNYGFLVWSIAKVKADGTEEFINDLQQNLGDKPYRYAATTEGVCSFESAGKYRIYLYAKGEVDYRHDAESNYIGKTEFIVE